MKKARLVIFALATTLVPLSVPAQSGKSVESMLKTAPRADEARVVNANLPELVNLRVSQLEEDLNLTPAQLPLWNAYRARVQSMLDDVRRGARVSASETNAPNRLDALADSARNRLTAVEDIVDAGKALYAALTPQQKEVADRRLALPLATLTGNDGGGDARRCAEEIASRFITEAAMNDLTGYIIEEFLEDYAQGRLSRRDALRLIGGLTGTALAAQMVDARAQAPAAPAVAPAAAATRVAPDDPAIVAGPVRFAGNDGELSGYLARPARAGRFPIVLVCHENRGLTPHIEDVTRRLAKAGYVGMAVDLLSREGGTAKHAFDSIPGLLGKAPQGQAVADFQSALAYAKAQPYARPDRVGMMGFCFGGGMTWRVAAATPDVVAAVPFYGQPLAAADVPKLGAAVLAIYASNDDRINTNIPAIEAAMQGSGKTWKKVIYPDSEHGFHNDTSPRFNADAAKAAWDETLAWFAKYLG